MTSTALVPLNNLGVYPFSEFTPELLNISQARIELLILEATIVTGRRWYKTQILWVSSRQLVSSQPKTILRTFHPEDGRMCCPLNLIASYCTGRTYVDAFMEEYAIEVGIPQGIITKIIAGADRIETDGNLLPKWITAKITQISRDTWHIERAKHFPEPQPKEKENDGTQEEV